MLVAMAAASSALDLIKTLTQGSASSKTAGKTKFSAGAGASTALATPNATDTSRAKRTSLISPDTMNALFAAQSGNDPSPTTAVEQMIQARASAPGKSAAASVSISA